MLIVFYSYDADAQVFTTVTYIYVNSTNMTDIGNMTYDDFVQGRMPTLYPVEIPEELQVPVYYEMAVTAATCKYWSPFYEDFVTDGFVVAIYDCCLSVSISFYQADLCFSCEVGPLTLPNMTHCICDYLTPPVPEDDPDDPIPNYERKVEKAAKTPGITIGGGISIPFNTIDLSNSAFNNLGENPLIFTVMVSIMCLYLCCCIWAVSADRKDAIKAGVSPLLDNDPRDRYLYEVTIYTGSRSKSGTTAKVSVVFSGEEDETQPRLMFDDKRDVLQSGGVDSFVMAVPRSLGSLSHVRVWHDNSGRSPSWFFSRMQVVDMQTLDKYFFILDRWLAADEDDGILDRIVPLAGKDELTGFSHVFFTKAKKDLYDGHIWFSVFAKPHKSNFTRVQRLTCCLALLFACMTANIFLYRSPEEQGGGTRIRIGPLELTVEGLLTGAISSLIAFPINILIVFMFKYTKPAPYNLRKKCCAPCRRDKRKSNSAADELAQQARILDGGGMALTLYVASIVVLLATDSIVPDPFRVQ